LLSLAKFDQKLVATQAHLLSLSQPLPELLQFAEPHRSFFADPLPALS
jgi:hypothetical protein